MQVDQDLTGVRGRVRSVASERETTFTDVAGLIQFVRSEAQQLEEQPPDALASESESKDEPK